MEDDLYSGHKFCIPYFGMLGKVGIQMETDWSEMDTALRASGFPSLVWKYLLFQFYKKHKQLNLEQNISGNNRRTMCHC